MGLRFVRAKKDQVLLRTRVGEPGPKVFKKSTWLWPLIHRLEVMDVSTRSFSLELRGPDAVTCRDGTRADVSITFSVRPSENVEDIVRLSQAIGCHRVSDPEQLKLLFTVRFSTAVTAAAAKLRYEELSQEDFRHGILEQIGTDLMGFVIEDCTVDSTRASGIA